MILDAGCGSLYIQLFYSPRVSMCVIYVDWCPLVVGLQSLLTLYFISFSFEVLSSLLSKICRVFDSITLEGSLFHWFATRTVKTFCLSPFSDLCQYSLRMWPLVGRLVELLFCIGINSVTDFVIFSSQDLISFYHISSQSPKSQGW